MGRKVSGDAGGINIANSLRANYVFPTAALLEFPDTCGYTEYSSDRQSPNETANHSFGLEETDQAWRIDGAHFGVLYHVIPQRWGPLAPYRIDLRIPDQTEWPSDCWDRLDARDSVHMSRERIRKLGIARHLVKVRSDTFSPSLATYPIFFSFRLNRLSLLFVAPVDRRIITHLPVD